MQRRVVRLAIAVSLLWGAPLSASTVSFADLPSVDAVVDLAVPESPAFTALGFTPETVTRPTSPREFATGALTGLDPAGNFQAGLALDTAPWMFLHGNKLTLQAYRESLLQRQLSRFQLSLATTRGTEDADDATRIALGLRQTPWDRGDPRLDYTVPGSPEDVAARAAGTVPDDLQSCLEAIKLPRPNVGETLEEWRARTRQFADGPGETMAIECHEKAKKRLWNRSAWDIAAAPSWIQENGVSSGSQSVSWNGATFWSSLAYGFEEVEALRDTSQLILHVRYRLDEQAPVAGQDGVFRQQDSFITGMRFRIGKPDLSFSLEGAYLYTDPKDSGSENAYRLAGQADFKLPFGEQLWVKLGLGGTGGNSSENKLFILAELQWGGQSVNLGSVLQRLNPPPAL